MIWLILRRVAAAVVLLLVITAATFVLMSFVPDPSQAILGQQATQAEIAAMSHDLGLDRPVAVRYLEWLGHAIQGDFGVSWFTHLPVTGTIAAKLPITASLAVLATAISAVLGIALGMAAAVRGGWLDKAVQASAALAFAIPGLWFALLLVVVFAVQLRWLPAIGYVSFAESPQGWVRSLVLPVTAIAVGSVAAVAAQTRSAVATILAKDWVRTLRSRGLPRHRVLLRHVLRNAAPPALTIVSLQFVGLFGGAIVIEQVFALQGLGTAAAAGATRSDAPLVLGVVVVGAVLVIVVNLVVDLAVSWLDPKVRT